MSQFGGGGLLQRLFQGARDRRRNPSVRTTQNTPDRFDAQGNLNPGQPARPSRADRGGQVPTQPPPERGPNPLDPSVQLNQPATQRRQDTRFQFEEAKQELEDSQGGGRRGAGFLGALFPGRRQDLDEKRNRFLQASIEAGKSANAADILSDEEQAELVEGDQLQQRLQRQGALAATDLTRAQELGILDDMDPAQREQIERTALLDAPTVPGGSGQQLAIDRQRLTNLAPIGPDGNPLDAQGGGVTQILNPETVDEFLFNVSVQPEGTRQQLFRAISKAGGADAIFESSGGNVAAALELFGDSGQPGGGQFNAFGSDEFSEENTTGTDLLESMGILFGGQPGFTGAPLPGTDPTTLVGATPGGGVSSSDEQLVQQNLLAALFQLGFGGRGGSVPLPTGTFG